MNSSGSLETLLEKLEQNCRRLDDVLSQAKAQACSQQFFSVPETSPYLVITDFIALGFTIRNQIVQISKARDQSDEHE